MQNWVPVIAADNAPKYAAIADAIAGAIRTGDLRPGERLPPQRDLARELGVDLTTVTRAYGLARDAGLIEGAGKLGSFVRNDVSLPKFGETANERGMNVPPQPAFNLLPEAIRTGTAALLRAGRHSPILQYQPSLGNILDRQEAAAALSTRGIATGSDEVVIAAGAQHALHGIVATIMKPGDRVCCARFIYPGMIALARRFGLILDVVETDAEGMLPDALAKRLQEGARFVYLTPTNDNPTTTTMSIGRREAIVATVVRAGGTIIEDDAYGLLPSNPAMPCAGFAPERCWHISSTSKILSPVVRVAHVRAPSAEHALSLAADISETTVMAPPLNAALVAMWLRNGLFSELVAGVRAEAILRRRIVARHLSDYPHDMDREGYHLWVPLPVRADVDDIVRRTAALGLSIVCGSNFDVERDPTAKHVRISVGGAIDHAALDHALIQFRRLLQAVGLPSPHFRHHRSGD